MTRPLLTVVVPTIGRDTLPRMLQSVRDQAPASQVELLIVGDTYAGDFARSLAQVPALCAEYDARYLEHDAGAHMVGQAQRQYGMAQARGRWLMFSQDDNEYRPGALPTILAALRAGPRCPHLFRVMTRFGFIVWQQRGDYAVGMIDADCIAVPNAPARLGRWALEYAGDQAFIAETIDLWRGRVIWQDAVVVSSRPRRSQYWGNVG